MDERGEEKRLTKKLGFHQLVFTFIHYKEILEKSHFSLMPFCHFLVRCMCRLWWNIENSCADYGGT
jgi:hypothetical protein